jgi:hypothetical protein
MELICILGICFSPVGVQPQCPQTRTHPEAENLANCISDREWGKRNDGIINRPNVCDSINSIYMTTKQEEEYWRKFKCPMG